MFFFFFLHTYPLPTSIRQTSAINQLRDGEVCISAGNLPLPQLTRTRNLQGCLLCGCNVSACVGRFCGWSFYSHRWFLGHCCLDNNCLPMDRGEARVATRGATTALHGQQLSQEEEITYRGGRETLEAASGIAFSMRYSLTDTPGAHRLK